MIKNLENGKVIYEFGKGDVDIFCFKKNDKVYLGFKNGQQKEVNKIIKSNYKNIYDLMDDCDGFMGFCNTKSIDVVINQLEELKRIYKLNHEELVDNGYKLSEE